MSTHYTIEKINKILSPLSIAFSDSSYKSINSNHYFECLKCNHRWLGKLHSFFSYKNKKAKGCPECSYTRWTQTSIQKFLIEYSIPFILVPNQKVVSGQQALKFTCFKGHSIKKPFSELKRFFELRKKTDKTTQYCKECRSEEFKINQFNHYSKLLKSKPNLTLIKIEDNKTSVHLFLKCNKGHLTDANISNVRLMIKNKVKTGCKTCDSNWWDIDKIAKTIKDSGFQLELLDKKYVSNHHRLKFRCLECKTINKRCWGDVLKKIRKNHKDKTICKKCHHKRLTTWNLDLIRKHLIKIDRKIECIAKKYKTNKTKITWRCLECQKVWNATWKSINISEQGCPECNFVGKSEIAIREFLSKVFKRKFSKIRPDWLNSHLSGRNLEIDCWNESLNLGVEVNGEQHYKLMRYYGDNINRLKRTQANDAIKVKICKKMNITLIVMPIHDCPKSKYKERLKQLLVASQISIPKTWDKTELKV